MTLPVNQLLAYRFDPGSAFEGQAGDAVREIAELIDASHIGEALPRLRAAAENRG